MSIKELEPKAIWTYFSEITQIPRPSKKEEKIIQYLLDFARKHNLEAEKDAVGNVIIRKPATKGCEHYKSVVMQSHSDMVCEKNADTVHNFDTDPIQTYIENGWVKAKGTTLGADDGIGMAAALAVLASDTIKHGAVEALFTSDEETGMTGAFGLQDGFIKSKVLINLDSEDEGELYIGCSGGIDTVATFKYKKRPVPKKSSAFKLAVTGLRGGHSGDEINKGLGNANKILNRILLQAAKIFNIRLATFDGGNLRNAIAREAFADITVKSQYVNDFKILVSNMADEIKNEFNIIDPNLSIKLEDIKLPEFVINKKVQKRLLHSLQACWHGVYAMSHSLEGLVETSTNLASVKFIDDNKIRVETSQRSSVESAKKDMMQTVASVFKLAGAKTEHGDGYPGWTPNTDSEILRISETAYTKLFDTKPAVKAIHAGLECGLFLTKYPDLDMISIGPTVRGAHSPDERIEIDSVRKFWDLLVEILENMG